MDEDLPNIRMLQLTAQIVSAQVAKNATQMDALSGLIRSVYASLTEAGQGPAESAAPPEPAVPVKKSIFPSYLVCLEDGKRLKMLKRHLATTYKLTPAQYRVRWGLPSDYPMVAPDYSAHRSRLATAAGLGRKAAPVIAAAPAKRRRKAA